MTEADTLWRSAPAEPSIDRGELDVWRIDLDADAWSRANPLPILAEDEIQRAARFHFERDRRRFVAGRAAVRWILAAYSGVPAAALRFIYGEQGKPALETPSGDGELRFNLSHSRGLAVCGVTRLGELGVDVERIRSRVEIDRIARRFFSKMERVSYRSLEPGLRREAFFRCWTRKEAFLKALGRGVFGGSTGFDVTLDPDEPPRLLHVHGDPEQAARWSLHDLTPREGYVGAVIVEGSSGLLRRWRFDPAA